MPHRLDVVLFGATGYTGKYSIKYLHTMLKEKGYTWGISGRSETKLKQVLADHQKSTGEDVSKIPIIAADVEDFDALKKMTAQARVLINLCGPYRLYGESVIKACIETGTHQVDITGEPEYVMLMQLKHHKAAQEKGVYIINACGFDCIATDLGVLYTAQQFDGTLNSMEVYVQLKFPHSDSSTILNYGTWCSIIDSMSRATELKQLQRTLHSTPLPKFLPKLKKRIFPHKPELMGTWNILFPSGDEFVSSCTQRHLYEQEKVRPIQVEFYLGLKSGFWLFVLLFYGIFVLSLSQFSCGRKLLLKHPKFFSKGLLSHDGPTKEVAKNVQFSLTFSGKGWKEKLSEPDSKYTTPPSESIVCRISGSDPGYGFTSEAVIVSALTILEEFEKLPGRGGIYTPGAAFYRSSILNRLQSHMKFEVVSKNFQ